MNNCRSRNFVVSYLFISALMFILNIPWVLKLVRLALFVDYMGCLSVRFLTNKRFSVVK